MPSLSSEEPGCRYPQSHATAHPIKTEIELVAKNSKLCTSFYLDTVEGMSNDTLSTEGEDHHQGLARTPLLSDGSIWFFLSHSEVDPGDQGSVSSYRYGGATEGGHVMSAYPLTVAPMQQIVMLNEQHPSDIVFLPDVDGLDAGYLLVTEEYGAHVVSCYRWDPVGGLVENGLIPQGFPTGGPNYLFIDRVEDVYYLGVASNHWGWGQLLTARAEDVFPGCTQGCLDVGAFKPARMFPFPVDGASQTKLIRDAMGAWYLLGFRSDPTDDPNGTDYVDAYGVTFAPFQITPLLFSTHVSFRSGDTGFASTGTHYVEPAGRLLISSSYRWAEDEGPGDSSFVSRVDECPSL